MLIKADLLPANYTPGRGGSIPDLVVIHVVEGSASSARNWFRNPVSKVSSHYLIALDRKVYQFVDEADTAWANGRVDNPTARLILQRPGLNPNRYSISIENEGTADGEWPDTMYDDNAQLVAEICARWDIPVDRNHIVGHREIYSKKTCPGKGDVDRIVSMARERTCKPTLPARVLGYGDRGDDVKELQKLLKVQPQSGFFGKTTLAAVKNFQRKQGLEVDGVVGPWTRAKLGL